MSCLRLASPLWPRPCRILDQLYLSFPSDVDGGPLGDRLRLDGQKVSFAVACGAACLGNYEAHRGRLEQEPQLPLLASGVGGVSVDPAPVQYLVDVGYETAAVPELLPLLLKPLYERSVSREPATP